MTKRRAWVALAALVAGAFGVQVYPEAVGLVCVLVGC